MAPSDPGQMLTIQEIASYCADVLGALKGVAAQAQLDRLTAMIADAAAEADRVARSSN